MNSTRPTQIYNGPLADLHWAYTMVWLSGWVGIIRNKSLKPSTQALYLDFSRFQMGPAPSLPPWFWENVMDAGPCSDEVMGKFSLLLAQVLGEGWSKFPGAAWAIEQWPCCPLKFTTAFRTQTSFCLSLEDMPVLRLSKEAVIPQHRPINISVSQHLQSYHCIASAALL